MSKFIKIIDDDGYFVREDIVDVLTDKTIETPCNASFFKPKWTGNGWVEGKTEEEFLEDAFLASLNPSAQELAKAERQLEIIELLMEMGLV